MSLLSGPEILNQIEAGHIVIDPFDASKVGPNSVDLHLGPQLLVYNLWDSKHGRAGGHRPGGATAYEIPHGVRYLDAKKENPVIEMKIDQVNGFLFHPGILYLGHTIEFTETHKHVPCVETTSSAARLGVSAHLSAGFGDCFFKGTFTLEITVVQQVVLYVGMPICQIYYNTLEGEVRNYQGSYTGQQGPRPSMLWKKLAAISQAGPHELDASKKDCQS